MKEKEVAEIVFHLRCIGEYRSADVLQRIRDENHRYFDELMRIRDEVSREERDRIDQVLG